MKKVRYRVVCALAALIFVIQSVIPVSAKETWPKMPQVEAPSFCVMDISTGTILYERNMDEINYPASITKVMTALLAVENCSLDEIVTFSEKAVYGNEGDTSHISRDIGEEMTMEESLYGMMLESANECAWAIGEQIASHVGGSMEQFTKMMNERAASLGCTNTHFNNPNGLPDEDHWTSAHDMALIAAEAYKNETFRVIAGTKSYTIPPTNKHEAETPLHNHHKMIYPFHGDYAYLYDYATGGKTGYTNAAGNTLVTFAEKDGMSLVCVVMREQTPNHYVDTRTLFDYCFENFKLLKVADYEKNAQTDREQAPFASIDENAIVILPASADFSDLKVQTVYDSSDEDVLGTFVYTYAGQEVGRADVRMNEISSDGYVFTESVYDDGTDDQTEADDPVNEPQAEDEQESQEQTPQKQHSIHIEINVRTVATAVGVILLVIVAGLIIYWLATHSYLIRQKIAGMKSRRSEKNRYQTIHDTRKSRKRRRQAKKSKNLRF